MVITTCQRAMKLFPPTWQHHHLMIASTIVPIIQWQLIFFLGVDQYTKANLRLDASLPPCTLRKSKEEKGTRRLRQPTIAEQLRFMSTLTKKGPPFSSGRPSPRACGQSSPITISAPRPGWTQVTTLGREKVIYFRRQLLANAVIASSRVGS